MKKIYTTAITLFFCTQLFSQSSIPFDFIDIGGVKAIVHADGHLFQDKANGAPSYEVPRGGGNHAIFSSAFWMSSQEVRNNFPHYSVAYESFGLGQSFKMGPVDIVNQVGDVSSQFQRLWKINKSEIDNHITNWNTSGYVAPNSIIDWPGNGNANTAKVLAPFMDLDNDSIYEPLNGEYPLIKGDQAIYTISNSYLSPIQGDSLTQAARDSSGMVIFDSMGNVVLEPYASFSPMKIETHLMVYAFATNNLNVLNSVFVNVKLYNRSNSSIGDHNDFRLSVYNDFDLGNPSDDYVGTDTLSKMFYAYNGDSFDDGTQGKSGYGSNLPAIGVKFLNKDLLNSMYFNIGTGNNGDPTLIEHFSNYQRNIWKNGQPVYYSGDGFLNCVDTSTSVNFMFDGDPTSSSTNQWTEATPCVVGTSSIANPAGDRRMIGGPSLPSQFNHGTSIEFDYAYVFAQSTVSNTDAVTQLKIAADSVQQFFNNSVVTGLRAINNQNVEFNLFPNPTKDLINLNIEAKQFNVTLLDIKGVAVAEYTNTKTIDVSGLADGVYFVRVKTNEKVGTKKLIKIQ